MRPEKPGPVSCAANANGSKRAKRKQGREQTGRQWCRGQGSKTARKHAREGVGSHGGQATKSGQQSGRVCCRLGSVGSQSGPCGRCGPRRHRRGRGHLFPHNPNPPTSHSQQTLRQPPPPPNTLGMQTHSTRHTQQTAAAPHTASHTPKTGVRRKGVRRARHSRQPRGTTYGQEGTLAKRV